MRTAHDISADDERAMKDSNIARGASHEFCGQREEAVHDNVGMPPSRTHSIPRLDRKVA